MVGADRPESGRVFIQGREVHARGPADTVDRGVGFLPEDRKTQGLVLGLAVQSNLGLPSARRLSRLGVLDARGAGRAGPEVGGRPAHQDARASRSRWAC